MRRDDALILEHFLAETIPNDLIYEISCTTLVSKPKFPLAGASGYTIWSEFVLRDGENRMLLGFTNPRRDLTAPWLIDQIKRYLSFET